jgi:hypothetical protein
MISLYRLELAPLVSTHAIIAWDGRMEGRGEIAFGF